MDDINPTEICAAKKNKPWIGGGSTGLSATASPDGYGSLNWEIVGDLDGSVKLEPEDAPTQLVAGAKAGTGYVKVSDDYGCSDSRPFTVVKVEFPDTKPVLLEAATDTEWASKEFGETKDVPIDVTPTGRTLQWELSTAEVDPTVLAHTKAKSTDGKVHSTSKPKKAEYDGEIIVGQQVTVSIKVHAACQVRAKLRNSDDNLWRARAWYNLGNIDKLNTVLIKGWYRTDDTP